MNDKQKGNLVTAFFTVLIIVVLGVFVTETIREEYNSADQFKNYTAARDSNCTQCLCANNYTVGKMQDYPNLTPYILERCPDCKPLALIQGATL